MKSVTSFTCIFLLIVSFNIVYAKNFSDVKTENRYYETITLLSDKEIVNGYADGTFGINKTLTRAEFVVILFRALQLKTGVTTTDFTDVPKDHWAYNKINTCVEKGYISGYGDNLFGPNDEVTYEQAIKILVCVIEKSQEAITKGGYPNGYLSVGNNYGINKNILNGYIGTKVTRGMICQMIYNSIIKQQIINNKNDVTETNENSIYFSFSITCYDCDEKEDFYYTEAEYNLLKTDYGEYFEKYPQNTCNSCDSQNLEFQTEFSN